MNGMRPNFELSGIFYFEQSFRSTKAGKERVPLIPLRLLVRVYTVATYALTTAQRKQSNENVTINDDNLNRSP